jgi:hypothetical protein
MITKSVLKCLQKEQSQTKLRCKGDGKTRSSTVRTGND